MSAPVTDTRQQRILALLAVATLITAPAMVNSRTTCVGTNVPVIL